MNVRLARLGALAASCLALLTMTGSQTWAHDPDTPAASEYLERFKADREGTQRLKAVTGAAAPCSNGSANGYPCKNVDLLSFLPLSEIGGGQGNDIWGWTDPSTNKEYAIMGRTSGTSFVDISNPSSPVYLGNLPTRTSNSSWRDIKVYKNHAFVVSEASSHGMQVFDLTRLRGVTSPQTFTADANYTQFGNAHNIAINEETGFAYAVGSNTCSGGPHMINIQTPKSPTNAGCVSSDGYTHDTQCVVYRGPDADYTGRELCFNSNEDTVTVVDVTSKSTPRQIVRKAYTGSAYTHQGWLTEDHRYFLLDDELDEQRRGVNTQTYIFDMANVDAPVHTGTYSAAVAAIDHNQYVKGNYSYQANYRAGLRILDVSKIGSAQLTEAGYFDIYPSSDSASFNGAWSVYPYFPSGAVVVSGIEQGLFVLKPNLDGTPPPPPPPGCTGTNPNDVAITDNATVTSPIDISGCTGNASASSTVEVHIQHTYIGDLVVDLVAPDGSAYNLHNRSGGSANDINQTYPVNLSSEPANGSWTLRVRDAASQDTGKIDSWTLNLGAGSDPPPSDTVYADDFETATGWTVNPSGSDTATTGAWERGDPEGTSSSGVTLQLGDAAGGTNALVTGRLAGSSAGAYDVDGGVTSIRSPSIALPSDGTLTLSLSWYLAHLSNASSADYFRVRVVTGSGTTTVFEKLGAASNVAGSWQTASVNLTSYAGQSIRIQVEAADASTGSLIEAGVDNVRILKS